MARLLLAQRAVFDLAAIKAYVSLDDPKTARELAERLFATMHMLGSKSSDWSEARRSRESLAMVYVRRLRDPVLSPQGRHPSRSRATRSARHRVRLSERTALVVRAQGGAERMCGSWRSRYNFGVEGRRAAPSSRLVQTIPRSRQPSERIRNDHSYPHRVRGICIGLHGKR
jgi:hypothetical protein